MTPLTLELIFGYYTAIE